jgi:hypothetical protein
MAAKRATISKTTRFEVFKRDKFTCQYCGRQAPDVLLVVDHINPVSKGGENTLLNYATSCEACNAGKGARALSDESIVVKQRAEVARLAERREQVEMMLEWHKTLAASSAVELDSFVNYWASLAKPFGPNATGYDLARKWLRQFTLLDLLGAADVSAGQYLQRDESGDPTIDSVNVAYRKIPGVARLLKLPAAERDLYYVRGILKNRFTMNYEEQAIVLAILTSAMDVGIGINDLKQYARSARTKYDWQADMEALIERMNKDARA